MRFNDRYGHSSVLCRYARIPEGPVPVIIPHGIYCRPGVCGSEREVPDLPVLSYPEYRDAEYSSRGYQVIPCASPFIYALDLHPVSARGAGTLFFLAHSTPGIEVRFDIAATFRLLEGMPGPVTVCLHPHDDTPATRSVFAAEGIGTVSAGAYRERDFLFRLIDMIGRHRYVASNVFGTHAIYALACGRPMVFVGDEPEAIVRKTGGHVPPSAIDVVSPVRALCLDWREEVSPEQAEMARYYLRADAKMTPAALAGVLR